MRRSVEEYCVSTLALLLMLRGTALCRRSRIGKLADAAKKCLESLLYTYITTETAAGILAQLANSNHESGNGGLALVAPFLEPDSLDLKFARLVALALDEGLQAATTLEA